MHKLIFAAAIAAGSTQPAFAQDDDRTPAEGKQGVRFEARAIYETPTVSNLEPGDDVYEVGSAFAFGGEIGFEHGFGESFYGRIEFGYADNGEILGINFQRRHAGLMLGARF